ncbi:MAG: nucleotidyltransferase domain-containing protein [Promethearchaeia archaeon]
MRRAESQDFERNKGFPNTEEEMTRYLGRKLRNLFKQYDIEFACLGGSWAENRNQWWSDVDIFVSIPKFKEFPGKQQLSILTKLHVKASELAEIEKIEISVLQNLPLHVQFNAIKYRLLIYEQNPQVFPEFLEKLLPLYYDHKIWYDQLLKEADYIK